MQTTLRLLIQHLLTIILLIVGFFQQTIAHTVIEPPKIAEGKPSNNHIVITHGCGESPVIGHSIVFPDGVDSTITVDGNPHNGSIDEFLLNWGGAIQFIQDRSLFSEQDRKTDANGNTTGLWFGGGRTLAPYAWGRIPFVSSAILFNDASCAKSVIINIAAADICRITGIGNMNNGDAVNFWTPAVGSKYDGLPGGHAYDLPVTFTVNRNLKTNPLLESCGGTSQQVTVSPSAEQVDRDMPIIFDGTQVWPRL
ncbi:hypothetical protein [Nitrosomonas sp.]|uniref:hypothetical protein n=1 Tax=Nitrosomonas sp. TaxID=42353 RepID=UPI0025E5E14C|nr:hypothetical protein [Nitrosomonas sp.]